MVGLLASCSSMNSPTPATKPDGTFTYAITINLRAGDTREGLEQRYSGQVKVWNDQDGYAILGSDTAPASDPAVRGVDNNANAYTTPETQLAAVSPELSPEAVGAGSWSAWSGGTGISLGLNENQPIWANFAAPMVTGALALAIGQNVMPGQGQLASHVEQGSDNGINLINPRYIAKLGAGSLDIPKFFGRIGL